MEINAANGNGYLRHLEGLLSGRASAGRQAGGDADAQVSGTGRQLVRLITERSRGGEEAVQQARQLLRQGAVDTPDAARGAAENIVDFGI